MTTPNQPPSFLDIGNPLITGGPARLDCGVINHPQQGLIGVATVRTSSATVTVILTASDLEHWGKTLEGLKEALGGGSRLVPASTGDMTAMQGTLEKLKSR